MSSKKITYKDSGVDIKAGEEMVESIKGLVQQTHSDAVLRNIGGFGGFFRPNLSSYSDPVFVSSVDGVGTKLIVAFKCRKYNTVGQDLVNHCVNDIAVCGADPLFFLDYFSTGKLEQKVGYQVVKGFAQACKENDVALIGGETAEMPDIYSDGEFDLAGTIVGLVDRDHVIDGSAIEEGDLLLGVPSSGLHTNGYSLARKVLFSKYEVSDHVDQLDTTVGEAMLKVHKSYLPIIKKLRDLDGVNGFSHITGGGIIGNTKRVVPDNLTIQLDWDAWNRPAIFEMIQEIGNVPEDDMRATFNLGIGLIVIVNPDIAGEVRAHAAEMNEEIIELGKIGSS
ncbi:phosphoribosylformylglycinamidine cyclo-ligase [Fodinibius sediminis]|uniref:Phosphoribosylformylglycinamidine cyclo-ligase n=1 Tax=Fodinibius sediminis TaxID=1214077 RepID=A0A521BEJ6_9BACT|nr:phosphoribosylformylglycinamidine cyclo-ligase [Fodinibius sediminis]SMO45527.1 phosphoribosylformylglycinamidine cyclo-ligase [Fodinibius sediminis]